MMRILCDENIPFAREAFAPVGEVCFWEGRTIPAGELARADALVVRSVTPVTGEMLRGTPIRFVATATAGTDHLDLEGLARAGIVTASAAGSNAESVAQHVASVLCHFHKLDGVPLAGRSIGIVGVGHCGSRVARVARALGMEPVLCDPPRAQREGEGLFQPLDALRECDVISVHVPLIQEGGNATIGLIGAKFFSRAQPGMIIVQASRGGVVEEAALRRALESRTVRAAALDVWENEPCIAMETLQAVRFATPHIAGHSFDGKLLGTEMIHTALCRFANQKPCWRAAAHLPHLDSPVVARLAGRSVLEAATEVVLQTRPLMEDDALMRRMSGLSAEKRAGHFDALRRHYPERREFQAWPVRFEQADSPELPALREMLLGLGFRDPRPGGFDR